MDFSSLRRILVCLRYGIGDVVMETPALRAVRSAAPRARITALGAAPATEIVERGFGFDELAVVQGFGLSQWEDHGDERTAARVEQWLAERDFELVLDVSHAVACVRQALWRKGGILLDTGTDTLPGILARGGCGQDAVSEEIRLGWGLELNPEDMPRLVPEPDEDAAARAVLRERGLPADGRVVAVSAVASSPLKRWPVERLARVADVAAESGGLPVAVLAGPEREVAMCVVEAMRRKEAARIMGAMPLRLTAAILRRCAALVGNDTGLMHMAAAVGTPAVAVFGPTNPRIYLPPYAGCLAVEPDVDCALRRKDTFGPPECIARGRCLVAGLVEAGGCVTQVQERAVAQALSQVLASRQGGASIAV